MEKARYKFLIIIIIIENEKKVIPQKVLLFFRKISTGKRSMWVPPGISGFSSLFLCLSLSPKCINGYRQHTADDNPAMD